MKGHYFKDIYEFVISSVIGDDELFLILLHFYWSKMLLFVLSNNFRR